MTSPELDELIRKADWFEPLLEMVKRLAAAWDMERHCEFGSKLTFPETDWRHDKAMLDVLAFLKKVEIDPIPARTLTPDQLAIVKQWRQQIEPTQRRSDAQVWKDCQELDDLVPGYLHRLMNRRPLPWEENQ